MLLMAAIPKLIKKTIITIVSTGNLLFLKVLNELKIDCIGSMSFWNSAASLKNRDNTNIRNINITMASASLVKIVSIREYITIAAIKAIKNIRKDNIFRCIILQ